MTNLFFLLIFLPAALLLYWMCNFKARQFMLLVLNLLFYAGIESGYIITLAISVIFNLIIVLFIKNSSNPNIRKAFLSLGIVANLIPLAYFKYANFAASFLTEYVGANSRIITIIAPVGISFYVFKAISLLIDVYHNKPIPDIVSVFVYLTFFGQIISGPISRIGNVEDSDVYRLTIIKDGRKIFANISEGTVRFSVGLVKKILIANVLEIVVSEVFADSTAIGNSGALLLWVGSVCYSLQLYVDFSGYSDMAIGVTKMFGYNCPENFDYPYTTKSFSEFWRRWHKSLGSWFRDYVYIPIGGAYVSSKSRLFINLMIVWILTGLWHGANRTFIIWGLTYGCFVSFEKVFNIPKRLKGIGKYLYRIVVLTVINIEWVVFKSESLSYAWTYLRGMFHFLNTEGNARAFFLIKDYLPFIVAALLCSVPMRVWIANRSKGSWMEPIYAVISKTILLILFLISVSFIVAGANNPFAYANF